jgi:actinin alpha
MTEKAWEEVQKKTFTKWCNAHLVKKGFGPITSISNDWQNGIKLMELVNALYGTPFPAKYNKAPKMRPQMLDNIELALRMVDEAGIKTNFLKHTHLVDCDTKMLLGMVWAIILDYQIKGISVEELTAKEGLLLWCQRKTAGYRDVKVENFTTSWVDGLAFCALIHRHRPDLIDYDSLSKKDARRNLELAFDVADKQLGIPRLLDVEDLLDVARPDERSIVTYVSEYFHKFSAQNAVEIAGKRLEKLVAFAKSNDQLKADYLDRAQRFVDWVKATTDRFKDRNYDNTLQGIEGKHDELKGYKKQTKPSKTQEKLELEAALSQLQAKLRLNNRAPFQPPEHLTTEAIDAVWQGLNKEEKERAEWIRKETERQQRLEALASRFWRKAKALLSWGKDNENLLSSTDYGDSLAAVQAKLKNHESFESNFVSTQKRLDGTKDLGRQLINENYGKKDAVQAKVGELDQMWANIRRLADTRKAGLEKELARQQRLEELRLEFASKSWALFNWIEDAEDGEIAEPIKATSLDAVNHLLTSYNNFSGELRNKEGEFQALVNLSRQMESEGVTSNMYAAFTIDQITTHFNRVKTESAERGNALNEEKKRLEENDSLNRAFADKANAFASDVQTLKADLSTHGSGSLQEQLDSIKSKNEKVRPLDAQFSQLSELSNKIDERNITYNPYTEYTIESLAFLLDGLKAFGAKQQSLLEKQILDQSGSGVTEEQLAEFKETFKAFDKNKSNSLEVHEFKACLAALGTSIDDQTAASLINQLGKQRPGRIVFEEFVAYMVSKIETSDTPNTIKNAFKEIAGGKDYITEEDLKRVPGMSPETISYLLSNMPNNNGQYDFNAFTDRTYK